MNESIGGKQAVTMDSNLYSPQNTQELAQRKFAGSFEIPRIGSQESSGISGSGKRKFSVDPVETLMGTLWHKTLFHIEVMM